MVFLLLDIFFLHSWCFNPSWQLIIMQPLVHFLLLDGMLGGIGKKKVKIVDWDKNNLIIAAM